MIEIKDSSISDSMAIELISELNHSLAAITGCSGENSFDIKDMQEDQAAFVIGYINGVPMGCGAIRKLSDGIAEMKRVYARPNHFGLAHKIVRCLEEKAIDNGFQKLVLETRKVNEHAVSFYLSCGYSLIPNYGKYIQRRDAICFGKELQKRFF